MTAKEFRVRPSVYFPEFGSYEAFCLDEVCAHALIIARDEGKKAKGSGMGEQVTKMTGASLEQLKVLQHLGR